VWCTSSSASRTSCGSPRSGGRRGGRSRRTTIRRAERPGSLALPLILSAVFGALYWLTRTRPGFLSGYEKFDVVKNTLLFGAIAALIFLFVRAVDALAFGRRDVAAPLLLRQIVAITLYFLLFALAIAKIYDYDVRTALAGGAVVAAILGLALQDTLGNLFSGIALHLETSFEVGDVLHSGEYVGVVEGVSWRATRLRGFNNQTIILPNSVIARERLEVFPRNNLNGRVLPVNIDYHVPPAKAIEVLTHAAAHVDGVAREQPCFARVAGFGDSAVLYEIKYFVRDYSQRDVIDAAIRRAVWYALRRNDIAIPFPVRSFQPYTPMAAPEEITGDEVRKHLREVAILAPLSDDAHQTIAVATRIHRYAKGETILRRGAAGDSMFVLHSGEVSIRVYDPDETGTHEVATLGPGSVFGEMALLTGERRTADVVALDDVVALEIGKDSLQPVLQKHPELVKAISSQVMQRRDHLESLREESVAEEEQSLLSRIRSYFGV
jgi:small-conductance mechanosensitive channel/CRP-like cAMP-binding protein